MSVTRVIAGKFVPSSSEITTRSLQRLEHFLSMSRRLVVLTGAGVSTESGIRDYRSEGVGLYSVSNYRPMQIKEFLKAPESRQHYWARNAVAWSFFSALRPNLTHKFLAHLEHKGTLHWLVTQNVDNLHHLAGSRRLTELHGTMHSVVCLTCHQVMSREELQDIIMATNLNWSPVATEITPDADSFISDEDVKSFNTPTCNMCGGILKPNVTFFGESVLKVKVEDVNQRITESDSLMVMGSSCQTYSAYRHVHLAAKLQIPVCVVNIGPTRVDSLANLKIEGRCGDVAKWYLDSPLQGTF